MAVSLERDTELMATQNSHVPIVIHLNVEELVGGAWGADHSRLPALSSKGQSLVPEQGGHQEAIGEPTGVSFSASQKRRTACDAQATRSNSYRALRTFGGGEARRVRFGG